MANIIPRGVLFEAHKGVMVGVAIKEAIEQRKTTGAANIYLWFNEILMEIREESTFETVNRDYVYGITMRRMNAGG